MFPLDLTFAFLFPYRTAQNFLFGPYLKQSNVITRLAALVDIDAESCVTFRSKLLEHLQGKGRDVRIKRKVCYINQKVHRGIQWNGIFLERLNNNNHNIFLKVTNILVS